MPMPDVSRWRTPVRGGDTSQNTGTVCWDRWVASQRIAIPERTSARAPRIERSRSQRESDGR